MGMAVPPFGRVMVRVIEDTILVEGTTETVDAEPLESAEAFILRVQKLRSLGPHDRIEVAMKAGRPQYAVIYYA